MAPTLIDPFQRRIEYLRLSVTDRCDLRCHYCMPKKFQDFEEPEDWLNFDEIERVVRAFTELGVSRVRITGGEPLARRNLSGLAARLNGLPRLEDLSLSTNAVNLSRHAESLFASGISRINVSLDTLRPERFAEITGGGKLDKVLAGITVAREVGFQPIKINTVAMKGINDDEFEDMVLYCMKNGYTLRFIETMPMGDSGRAAHDTYIDLQQVRKQLERVFDLIPASMSGGGPARYYQVKGSRTHIGFITPLSQHFCETCNRVRLTVDGTLYLCLGQEDKAALRPLLRRGISDEELQQTLVDAIGRKPERHEFCDKPGKIVRLMSNTGG